jgi:ribonuclease-3
MTTPFALLMAPIIEKWPNIKDEGHLPAALRRVAWVKEHADAGGPHLPDHEALEWLGDGILQAAVSDYLWRVSTKHEPGLLTKARQTRVDAANLAAIARDIRLIEHIQMGAGERSQGQVASDKPLSDHLEAVVGACFLAGGWPCAVALVEALFAGRTEVVANDQRIEGGDDPKSALNLEVQRRWKLPLGKSAYQVMQAGPSHQPVFQCTVTLPDERVFPGGVAQTKKDAERLAAAEALGALRAEVRTFVLDDFWNE